MLREFKEFISKGNLVDIAVGFVMGAAFTTVVTAFTTGVVTPLVGKIFTVERLQEAEAGGILYGAFIDAVINFLTVGFVMFLVVKAYNRMRGPAPAETPAADPEDIVLLREIRDALNR